LNNPHSRGQLFVISAPSGAGKTSLISALLKEMNDLVMSISYTTRAPRPLETHGVDYFFIDDPEFKRMLSEQLFLEHAQVFTYRYGTSKAWVEKTLAQGQDIILELDWQGHRAIKSLYPDATGIFILPPSEKTLEERLMGRGQDAPEVIAHRMQQAHQEISHYNEYEYVIINHDLKVATIEASSIIQAERLRLARQQIEQAELINSLLPN
jgi:guanylate kinase